MNIIFGLPGPHDIPFVAPLWGAILVGSIIGFIVFRLLDFFVDTKERDN